MSRDKQIDEMAKHCTYHHNGKCFAEANNPTDCDLMCEMFGLFANLEMAGYRKASDVAREIFEEIEKAISSMKYTTNTPRKTVKVEELKEQVDWVLHEVVPNKLAELKEKYIQSEDTE